MYKTVNRNSHLYSHIIMFGIRAQRIIILSVVLDLAHITLLHYNNICVYHLSTDSTACNIN
jgi:hypothetical protein